MWQVLERLIKVKGFSFIYIYIYILNYCILNNKKYLSNFCN